MKEALFYRCGSCGNIVFASREAALSCCGAPMERLADNSVKCDVSRHLPDARMEDGLLKVTVGIELHPREPDHYIEWVYAETVTGGVFRFFGPGEEPRCAFPDGTKVRNVYAYCTRHGLWKCMKT